jgi:D-tyrosyl-tRNA(Tyr) deacylase
MKALIQRVTSGRVSTSGKIISEVGKGYVILLGVKDGDSVKEVELLAEKTVNLRIMSDETDKMNISIKDVNGEIMVISQFTLHADTTSGRRPSFIRAAKPDVAEKLYLYYIKRVKELGIKKVVTGIFGAYMKVEMINDGPVTIMLDSEDFRIGKTI